MGNQEVIKRYSVFLFTNQYFMDFSLLSIILLLLLCTTVDSLVFSHPHQIAKLFRMEEKLIRILRIANTGAYKSQAIDMYLETCEPRLQQIPLDFSDSHHLSESEYNATILEDLVGNPLHVYSLVDRLVVQLPELRKKLVKENKTNDLDVLIEKTFEKVEMPAMEDLEEATQAIARIQFVYRLDPVEMAEGIIKGVKTEGKLTVRQMMMIASNRLSGAAKPIRPDLLNEFALAIEWTEGALRKAKNSGVDKLMESYIRKFLKFARTQHNKHWESPTENRGNLPNEELFIRKIVNITGKELRFEELDFIAKEDDSISLDNIYNIHDFYALCRGEDIRFSYKPSNPMCKLTTKNDPYFYLAPIKEEIVSKEPLVHIYHGILTDDEMKFKTSFIVSRLKAAYAGNLQGSSHVSLIHRSQSTGSVLDKEHELLHKVSKKTGKLTQLETNETETNYTKDYAHAFEIGLYGAGGHFLPHVDGPGGEEYTFDNLWYGKRMATVIYYLSDVIGGSTVFPELGLAVTPSKGSALFWHNLDSFNNVDNRTLHASCPTALGIKWTSSRFIPEGGQIWKKPCTVKQEY